ncbi:type II secretion system minor pseudopilin GspI [Yersinia alsatica]|uniref:Type II secretion system protein I n=1 Tax=Yersinia alsatica TaxID=2890317 RepID=A0ABY5UT47_9GAMM|nr:type II secretion system minor pseudopilin GspI [Yersinia alsatica]UWM46662.1 type II secretion system minor pseudopilin GspI [Yersinia alsatica]CNL58888.1 general secretion pathway protein I [Yersinia frederiksenii]CNL85301.1 general secretion pathway protein I [Yersinia frederiksenii]
MTVIVINPEKKNSSNSAGFILLEVMIAMAIFSIAGVSMVKIVGEQLIRIKMLEDRITAYWVADNILAEINIKKIKQTENWVEGSELMMNKLWHWQSREIKYERINVVTVEVRSQVYNEDPDFILEGYQYINE